MIGGSDSSSTFCGNVCKLFLWNSSLGVSTVGCSIPLERCGTFVVVVGTNFDDEYVELAVGEITQALAFVQGS